MSFYEDPNIPDVNPYVREPQRDKDTTTFIQEPLTVAAHIDPDKHWIGESLPAAGQSELGLSGWLDVNGASPFPARVDHAHDTTSRYGVFSSSVIGAKTCAPGQTFLNNLDYINIGRNLLNPSAPHQLISMDQGGVWGIIINFAVARSGGGTFTNAANMVFFYTNGAFSRKVLGQFVGGTAVDYTDQCMDFVHYNDADVAANVANVQFAYQHNDSVNHLVTVQQTQVWRQARLVSA